MKCPKCGGKLVSLKTSNEPEGIRLDRKCLDCLRVYMVTKSFIKVIQEPLIDEEEK